MKTLFLSVLCLCFLFTFSGTCIALPVCYTVTGSAIDNDGSSSLSITGWIYIDDQIRHWFTGQPVLAQEDIDTGSYGYDITEFSLKVGEYDFLGTSGYLYLEHGGQGDLQWNLTGSGSWTRWNHQLFYFLNSDGSPQDSYRNLASIIHCPHTADSYPDLFSPEMWLSRQDPAPVPEPSTFVLVGSSLFGLLAFMRFRT